MLSLLASAVLLLAGGVNGQCVAGTGVTQTGTNNFVIDTFTGTLLFTYAINRCSAISLTDTSAFVKYTCAQDEEEKWWVTKTAYETKTCSGAGTEVETWSEDEATPGNQGYFQCDGNNNYAEIKISVDPVCTPAATLTLAGGLGHCASNPAAFDTKFYCDSTKALVQLYKSPAANDTTEMCDDNKLYCNSWVFGSSCAASATFQGTVVYGSLVECATDEGTNTGSTSSTSSTSTTEGESSASTHFTLLSLVVALFANLWH